jgi:CelD/BcsL family acetyltransferase involved in cellulose biosynthesis
MYCPFSNNLKLCSSLEYTQGRARMRITEVNDVKDFVSLKDPWNDLLARSNHTVFSTWEWVYLWWRHFGNNRRLLILLAEEDNKLIGIAPLMYSVHSMFGLRQGKIEFIGTSPTNNGASIIEDEQNDALDVVSNYNDFIIEEGHESCVPLFFDYLQNLEIKWSSADLTNIPENQIALSSLSQVSNNIKRVHKCLYTPLPSSNETFLRNIKRKDRKEMRRYLRQIEKHGFTTELVDCSKTHLISHGMTELFKLNQKRWNTKGLPGAFVDPRRCSFYLDIANSFSQNGWLGLYCLKLSGKTVAVMYGFKYKGKYYAYKTGMDPVYSRFSVGNLLFLNVMEKCIQEGVLEFDFMWGTDSYKRQFASRETCNYKAIVARKRLFGTFKHSLYSEYWRQGERLKYFHRKLL